MGDFVCHCEVDLDCVWASVVLTDDVDTICVGERWNYRGSGENSVLSSGVGVCILCI
jgi:hypothetical protein